MKGKTKEKVTEAALVKNPRRGRRRWAAGSGAALFWCAACGLVLLAAGGGGAQKLPPGPWAAAIACLFLSILMMGLHRAFEWERCVALRLGKFHKVRGPGLFFLIPFVDRAAQYIDIRIRVTDFSAQETLTLDSVTVTVDAICFWLVWDPQKAALEVEDYQDAVILACKTALRSAVSRCDLTAFLERGDLIEKQMREEVDRKTTEWGITVQYIEITDIQIPQALQEPLARLAQAEREKKGRVLLAEAEIEAAKRLEEAARTYAANPTALNLKILSILNEGLKAGSSMMLVPNSLAEALAAARPGRKAGED